MARLDPLAALGFPMTDAGIRAFQAAWNLGEALVGDGIVGPKTTAALATSYSRRQAGRGDLSEHFSAREFACKCGGKYRDCRRILIQRRQLQALEKYRARVGGPVVIVSGYRCPQHNAAVGGAKGSQHMYGTASDVHATLSVAQVRSLAAFTGIGYGASSGKVIHIDTRSTSSTGTPALWSYSGS